MNLIRFVYGAWCRLPCGASWRYSRFSLVRRLGSWWLPRWYGTGSTLGDLVQTKEIPGALDRETLDRAIAKGKK